MLVSSKRIRTFQETWPKLEKWFDRKQNILVRVDADADEEELYQRLECVLQHAIIQTPEGQWPLLYYCVNIFRIFGTN